MNRHANGVGMDFYHYWAIPVARDLTDGALGSPYPNAAAYAARLNALAEAEGDRRHKDAAKARSELDLTGTPLCYALLWPLPRSYSSVLAGFHFGQALAVVAAALGMARLLGQRWVDGALIGGALLVVSHPVATDMHVGNVNTLQLAALVGAAALAGRRGPVAAALTGACCCALVLLKPSVLAPCLGLLASAALGLDRRSALWGVAASLVVMVGLVLWPCWYFNTPGVWQDWLHAIHVEGSDRLAYPSEFGNYSLVRLTHEVFGGSIQTLSRLVLLGFVASGLAAVGLGARARGGGGRAIIATILSALADPLLMVSAGIVVTLGASPLAWGHYFTLALLPALWLYWSPARGRLGAPMAVGFLILTSSLLVDPLGAWLQPRHAQPVLFTLGWMALWAGLLERVAMAPRGELA